MPTLTFFSAATAAWHHFVAGSLEALKLPGAVVVGVTVPLAFGAA
jgi:hypothetical protein